mgnify:CR=1 FL=1
MWTLLKAIPALWWGVIGVLLAATVFSGWQLALRREAEVWAARAEQARAEAERDLAAFRVAYSALAATCAEQNRAIQAMRAEAEKRAQEAAAAIERAQADAEAHRRSAERLRRMLLDPAELTCEEAVQRAKEAL